MIKFRFLLSGFLFMKCSQFEPFLLFIDEFLRTAVDLVLVIVIGIIRLSCCQIDLRLIDTISDVTAKDVTNRLIVLHEMQLLNHLRSLRGVVFETLVVRGVVPDVSALLAVS